MKKSFILFTMFFAISLIAQEKERSLDSVQKLDAVIISANVIFGNKHVAKNRTGSAYFLSTEELEKYNFTDVGRALRSVPGVTITEEDGLVYDQILVYVVHRR